MSPVELSSKPARQSSLRVLILAQRQQLHNLATSVVPFGRPTIPKNTTATYTAPGREGVEGSVVPLHGPSPKILEFKTQYISERLRLRRRGTEEESGGESNRVGTEYAL